MAPIIVDSTDTADTHLSLNLLVDVLEHLCQSEGTSQEVIQAAITAADFESEWPHFMPRAIPRADEAEQPSSNGSVTDVSSTADTQPADATTNTTTTTTNAAGNAGPTTEMKATSPTFAYTNFTAAINRFTQNFLNQTDKTSLPKNAQLFVDKVIEEVRTIAESFEDRRPGVAESIRNPDLL